MDLYRYTLTNGDRYIFSSMFVTVETITATYYREEGNVDVEIYDIEYLGKLGEVQL